VVVNTRRYSSDPASAEWDKHLVHIVQKFELKTGWHTAWTDDPHMLAKAEFDKQRVILNLGWVVKSSDAKDRRRLAYLTDTLRRIRQAIDAAK